MRFLKCFNPFKNIRIYNFKVIWLKTIHFLSKEFIIINEFSESTNFYKFLPFWNISNLPTDNIFRGIQFLNDLCCRWDHKVFSKCPLYKASSLLIAKFISFDSQSGDLKNLFDLIKSDSSWNILLFCCIWLNHIVK